MVLELEDLPHDVTENVAQHLNPVDLLELSSVSDHWDTLLKMFKMPIREMYVSLSGMTYEERGAANILFGLKPYQKNFVHFFFYKKTDEQMAEIYEDPKTTIKMFDNQQHTCQIDNASIKIFSLDPAESFFSIIDHCLQLFPGPIHHVQLSYCTPSIDSVSLRILSLHQVRHCHKVTLTCGCAVSDQLIRLVFSFPKLFILDLDSPANKSFYNYKPINIRHLYMGFAEWVTRRSLFSFNSETIDLGDPRVTLQDLNAFIKKWLVEDTKVLKRFQVNYCRGWKWEHDKKGGKDLFEGIEWQKWTPKNSLRPKTYYSKESKKIDMEEGRDIKRSDGALASIKCDNFMFLMVVWKYPA